MTKYCTHRQHYRVTEISRKLPKSDFTVLANYCNVYRLVFKNDVNLRCQVQSIRPASQRNCKGKPDNVQSFCCDAYSLPAAHSQHQQNMR